jgi:hypothetical protein
MKEVSQTITQWQQINIMQIATDFNPEEVGDLSDWLKSPNDSVIELGIKLIVHFQQGHAIEENMQLLDHKNEHVINAYLWALGEMDTVAVVAEAVKRYSKLSRENKLELLRAIAKAGNEDHLAFLTFQLASDNFEIRYETLRAIKKCAGTEMILRLAKNSASEEMLRMANQVAAGEQNG